MLLFSRTILWGASYCSLWCTALIARKPLYTYMTGVLATFRCHNYDLDSPLDRETGLDIFKVDPEYEKHEAEYQVGCVFRSLHVLHHHCYAVLINKPMTC